MHDQEVRTGHIKTRLRLELQHEVAVQTVLQEQESPELSFPVLQAAQKRVRQLEQEPYKLKDWISDTVLPAIGALARAATYQHSDLRQFEAPKAMLTWASMDRALWLMAQKNPELLTDYVSDPQWFVENMSSLLIVFFDHSPLWIKWRGEDQVLVTQDEIQHHQVRRRLSSKCREAQFRSNQHRALRQQLEDHIVQATQQTFQQAAQVCQGGDKYRITIVDFPSIWT